MNQPNNKHTIIMIVACVIPLIAWLVMMGLGITGYLLWLPIVLLFIGGHLYMFRSHTNKRSE